MEGEIIREEKIYKGDDASIFRCRFSESSRKIAVKRGARRNRQVQNEIDCLRLISHPYIINVLCYSYDPRPLLVVPFALGGALVDIMHNFNDEGLVRKTMFRLLEALKHIHNIGIVHNDVKPDNILILDADYTGDNTVLSDFGLARRLDEYGLCYAPNDVGTWCYLAPERLANIPYTAKADIWAAGVTMFAALFNDMPFSWESFLDDVGNGLPMLHEEIMDTVSEEAADLLRHMLAVNPNRRPSAEEALRHPWFADMDE